MGYNPLRKYRGSKAVEVGILVAFTTLIAALVVWATR